ncbi:thiamine-phosphate kinase, partial [Micromonospora sp. M51]|nr:thiamine-phosphate kinase [Micromonospora sp. M51]
MSEHGGAGQHGRDARGGVGVSGIGEFGLIGTISARLSYGPTALLGP